MHIGNARSALYPYLLARHTGGTFILRIEDTDQKRYSPGAEQELIDGLHWLGMDYDEGPDIGGPHGPYRQTERRETYTEYAWKLVELGHAFPCFCTPERLEKVRHEQMRNKQNPRYDGTCRSLSPDEARRRVLAGERHVIRFKMPKQGSITTTDLVRGSITTENSALDDSVLLKSDGLPTYNFANVIDDHLMGITHVVRGEDLIDSTHRVLAIRHALGAEDRPEYAHLPLIVDAATRAKLSKRHGAVGLEDFRDEGYLPEALLNYIALLGWAPPEDGDEVLDSAALIAAFDLDRVTHSAAGFDRAKLDWLNGEWMRRVSTGDLVGRIEPMARERFGERFDGKVFPAAVALAQERSVTLRAALDQMDFLFVDDSDFAIASESLEKLMGTERVGEILDTAIAHVESCEWNVDAINLKAPIEEALGVKLRKAAPALYAAVEGRHQGLPLFDSIQLLGRDRALGRLRAARVLVG